MNHQRHGFLISLFIHAAVFVLVMVLTGSYAEHEEKPLVIDLSILEGKKDLPPGPPGPQESSKPAPGPPQPDPPKFKPVVKQAPPAPKPALQSQGPVPVAAKEIPESPAAPQQQASLSGNAGGGQAGSGIEGSGAGSGGGGGGEGGDLRNRYLAEHFAYIRDLIQKRLVYPRQAIRRGWEGKIEVSFVILENGRIEDVKVTESSGFSLLDDNVIDTVYAVAPFPKPPVKAEVRVPITYDID